MLRSILPCTVALSIVASVQAGDLNPPPGPVVPTFKTLDEVEPSTPINTLAGDGSAMHVISQPGAYHLTGNLDSPGPGFLAIRCTADNVTIDMRGFVIRGATTETLPAIRVSTSSVVRNGSIDNWAGGGIQSTGLAALIEDMTFDFIDGPTIEGSGQGGTLLIKDCTFRNCEPLELLGPTMMSNCTFDQMASAIDGPGANGVTIKDCVFDGQNTGSNGAVINLGNNAKLVNVTVQGEGQTAAFLDDHASVIGCTFTGNGSANSEPGLRVDNYAVVKDCVISDYGGFGIEADFGAVIENNMVSLNDEGGISAVVTARIAGNSVYANPGIGIDAGNGCVVDSNVVRSNGGDGIVVATDGRVVNNTLINDPINVTGTDNTIDSNSVADIAGNPIVVTGSGNIITRNVITSGTISVGAGNILAPTRTAATFNLAGPWDNFQP